MMKRLGISFFRYLLNNSESSFKLKLLSYLLNQRIAFNLPHKVKIESLSPGCSTVTIPLIRRNTNHLGSIHACAIATIGEFAAGLVLLKEFEMNDYRLIMKDIYVEYKKQAITDLRATVNQDELFLKQIKNELANATPSIAKITTKVSDLNDQEVAIVTTTWQLKRWRDIKFKVN